MSSALNSKLHGRPIKLPHCNSNTTFAGTLALPSRLRRSSPSLSLHSHHASLSEPQPSTFPSSPSSSSFVSSVGASPWPPQLSQSILAPRHILILNIVACAVAISATCFFCCAIPTLLAFKRAAESLEKLLDVTREELPDTMAAMRLSGMEIGDLTMELSDIGQEINQGIRSSTRVVRVAGEKLQHLIKINRRTPSVSVQEVAHLKPSVEGPALARSVRAVREGIVKSRSVFSTLFTLVSFSRWAFKSAPGKHRT